MQLSVIERMVLSNIKYDDYASLAASVDAQKILDFATLHDCIFMAREEIKLNCMVSNLLKMATTINASTTSASNLITDTDFDLPIIAVFSQNSNSKYLIREYPESILNRISALVDSGDPVYYMMIGSTTAGLSYIQIYPIPDVAGGTIDLIYKPVLPLLITSTDEDLLMRRYPMTIVKLASAYAFQYLKNDKDNFGIWYKLGYNDFKEINLREIGSDYTPQGNVEELIKLKRAQRFTK